MYGRMYVCKTFVFYKYVSTYIVYAASISFIIMYASNVCIHLWKYVNLVHMVSYEMALYYLTREVVCCRCFLFPFNIYCSELFRPGQL